MEGVLDAKDRKILYELDLNSRQAVSAIGKKVNLSKDAVKYRIQKMQKTGVIKSFNAVIDTGKLGYSSYRLFLKLYNTTPEKEKEIEQFFLNNKNMLWLVRVSGNWDINTWFLYKTNTEMNTFWLDLLERFGNHIEKKHFSIYTSATYFGRAYLANKRINHVRQQVMSLPNPTKLDEKDMEIIVLLSSDARISILEIARKTKLTSKTIISRIKRLESEKIIAGYRTGFDLKLLGYKYYKVHLTTFNITREKTKQIKQYIFQHPNIIYTTDALGGYDFEFEVQLKDDNELRCLLEDIRKRYGQIILKYETLQYYEEHRLRFFPELI